MGYHLVCVRDSFSSPMLIFSICVVFKKFFQLFFWFVKRHIHAHTYIKSYWCLLVICVAGVFCPISCFHYFNGGFWWTVVLKFNVVKRTDLFFMISDCWLGFYKKILLIFRERGREGERGRETSMCERYLDWLPPTCALIGNWTSDFLAHRPALSPLSHIGQGLTQFLK